MSSESKEARESLEISSPSESTSNTVKITIIWLLFAMLTGVSVVSHMDGGIIPAATDRIMNDLSLTYTDLGAVGSLDYMGRLIGFVLLITVMNTVHMKYWLILTLFLKSISLFIPAMTSNILVIYFSRILCGFTQVFFTIYIPGWCDQIGEQRYKTIMITLIQIGSPFGIVLGFGFTILIASNWILALIIQGVLLLILAVAILFFPVIYFSKNDKNSAASSISQIDLTKPKQGLDKRTSAGNLKDIMCNMIFIFSVLANSCLFLVMTALQFWTADYMKLVLNVTDDGIRTLGFIVVSIIGPTCGVIFGGVVGSFVGGYENKKIVILCFIFDILACSLAVPVGMMNQLMEFCIILWFFFFFIGSLSPLLTGIILSSLPLRLRGSAFSISSFILNLIGNLPAPFIYGILQKNYKETNNHLALNVIMYYTFSSLLWIAIIGFFRFHQVIQEFPKPAVSHQNSLTRAEAQRRRTREFSAHIAKIFGCYARASMQIIEDIEEVPEVPEDPNESKISTDSAFI